jgi:hypothetical protein
MDPQTLHGSMQLTYVLPCCLSQPRKVKKVSRTLSAILIGTYVLSHSPISGVDFV